MIYKIANNGDVVTLNIPVTNKDKVVTATGLTLTQTFPAGISIYGTPVITAGAYNTLTKVWTIASSAPEHTDLLSIKIKVDDISLQPFHIKSVLAIVEPEYNLTNNERFDSLILGDTCETCDCDPCNFEEPIIITNNDTAGLSINLAENDTVDCPCCQKEFEVVGTPVNITVNSISVTGTLKYSFIDPTQSGSLVYRVNCKNCPNGLSYASNTSTVTFAPIVSSFNEGYRVKEDQTLDYIQESEFNYFRFDTATNAIQFTLLPASAWNIGKSIKVYVYDSSQSGPLVNNFTVVTDSGTETFTDTGLDNRLVTANYVSFEIVYVGSNKFDVI